MVPYHYEQQVTPWFSSSPITEPYSVHHKVHPDRRIENMKSLQLLSLSNELLFTRKYRQIVMIKSQ